MLLSSDDGAPLMLVRVITVSTLVWTGNCSLWCVHVDMTPHGLSHTQETLYSIHTQIHSNVSCGWTCWSAFLTQSTPDTALYSRLGVRSTPVCFSLAWAPIWLSSCQLGDFVQMHSPINVYVSLVLSWQKGWSHYRCLPYSVAMSTQKLHYAYMYGELSTVQKGISSSCVSSLLFPLVLAVPSPCLQAFTSPTPTLFSVPRAPVLRLSIPKHSWTAHELPQKIPIPSPLDYTIMNISRKNTKPNKRAM